VVKWLWQQGLSVSPYYIEKLLSGASGIIGGAMYII
jgi:hypothetical protein